MTKDQTDSAPMNEARSRSNTPATEQPVKLEKTPLDVISDILVGCQQYKDRVNAFQGCKKDKEYKLLEEMLVRSLLKLDGIESGDDDSIRQARKAAVKEIQSYIDQLELKAFSSEGSQNTGTENMQLDEASQNGNGGNGQKDDRDVREMVLGSEVAC